MTHLLSFLPNILCYNRYNIYYIKIHHRQEKAGPITSPFGQSVEQNKYLVKNSILPGSPILQLRLHSSLRIGMLNAYFSSCRALV